MQISNIENSSNAENALRVLAKEYFLENKVTTMNLSSLKKRFQSSDVFPTVRIDLVRDQDRKNLNRVELAQIIGGTMQTFLSETFSGDSNESEFVLRVNVSVVSDGSCLRKDRIASIIGRGKAQGYGLAKLAVSYCLFSRVSGDVVVVKQLCRWEDYHRGERSKLVVLDMATQLHNKISREIKFICSCGSAESFKHSKRQTVANSNTACKNGVKFEWSKITKRITVAHNEDDSSCSSTSKHDDDSLCSSTPSFFEN
jgi:hypothetical protein